MAAYIFGTLIVDNWDWYREYKRVTEALVAKHGGRYLVKGGKNEKLEGDQRVADAIVLIEFPDDDAARSWYSDPDYANMIALRKNSGVRTELVLVEGFDGKD